MIKKISRIAALIVMISLVVVMIPLKEAQAGTLTEARDYLGRMKENLTSGVSHEVYIKPATAVSGGAGNNSVILVFPDGDDATWCATEGTDLATTTSGLIETATALPGNFSAECTQGTTTDSYDTITVSGVDDLTAETTYGFKISDGSTAKLGTPAATTTGIITVKTNDGSDVDTKDIAVDVITEDQVGVSATVQPSLSFSISDTSVGFGTLTENNVYYATGDENGATSEPGADLPVNLTVSTNAPNGVAITVKDANDGLYSSDASYTISAVASSAVSGGSEGFGVYGKGAASLTIDEGFDNDTTSDVAISSSYQTFATAASSVSGADVDLVMNAGVSGTTPAGGYSDTITCIATGKF